MYEAFADDGTKVGKRCQGYPAPARRQAAEQYDENRDFCRRS
jgi:hypothetical protein